MSNGKLGFWSRILNHEEIFDKPIVHTKVGGKSTTEGPREEPATINLIRAVYDEADNVVKKIDRELDAMEQRRAQLLNERSAHAEMFEVAKKYVSPETKKCR